MKYFRLLLSSLLLLVLTMGFVDSSVFALESGLATAEVIEIKSEPSFDLDNDDDFIQVLDLKLLDGEFKGDIVEGFEYGLTDLLSPASLLSVGDKLIVDTLAYADTGELIFQEKVRTTPLLFLLGLFLVLVLVVAGWHGLRSFMGLIISIFVIGFLFIPQVLAGYSPLLLSLVYGVLIMVIALVVAHGLTRKTVAALSGTIISLVVVLVLAYLFTHWAGLTGFTDEEVRFLYLDGISFDFPGLLIGAMILGTLGVLDDVTVSQASLVFELDKANPKFTFNELFVRALRVGKDHIASTVNTLALAYVAAALPLFLLLYQGGTSLGYFFNFEIVAVEVVRMLVGSIGIVLSIPLTNYIACKLVKSNLLSKLADGESQGCGHVH